MMLTLATMLLAVGIQHPLYIFPQPPRYDEPIRNPPHRPVWIAGKAPKYPEAARRARISGIVIVELLIEKDGHVSAVHVVKPLPFGLDQSVVDAARTWRYKPMLLNGRPVRVIWQQAVNMRLSS
jgi:protein TonB